jgi:hypothetical protein
MSVGRSIGILSLRHSAVGLLLFLLASGGPATAQQPSGQTHVEISSSAGWTGTGVRVEPDDTLAIRASSRSEQLPPSGYSGRTLPNSPAPELPPAALIGRIGDGPPFLVGSGFKERMETGGPLELRWNMAPTPPTIGAAVFTVDISRIPAPPPQDVDEGNVQATVGNETAAEGNLQVGQGNTVVGNSVDPLGDLGNDNWPVRPEPEGAETNGEADFGPYADEEPSLLTPALWSVGGVGLLLVAAGAGLSLQQNRQSRRIERTRGLLSVSPSLDPGEGDCRGGDLPADGPAARFAARLEMGAIRWKGGEDG